MKKEVETTLKESFVYQAQVIISRVRSEERFNTVKNYETALRSLLRYAEASDLSIRSITADFVQGYQQWLKHQGISLNTISCYTRSLRAIYNKVQRRKGKATPFEHAYTGSPETAKRSIPASDMRKLLKLQLPVGSRLALSRDVFLFCFYCLGMPFIDVAFLRRNQISNGCITYYRRKTHQAIHIPIEPQIKEIIARYRHAQRELVFPILTQTQGVDAYSDYRRKLSQYNYDLRQLSQMAKLKTRLTSYMVRHTWASMAYERQVDLHVISKALGHDNPQTTLVYIRGINNRQLANANRRLLKFVTKD